MNRYGCSPITTGVSSYFFDSARRVPAGARLARRPDARTSPSRAVEQRALGDTGPAWAHQIRPGALQPLTVAVPAAAGITGGDDRRSRNRHGRQRRSDNVRRWCGGHDGRHDQCRLPAAVCGQRTVRCAKAGQGSPLTRLGQLRCLVVLLVGGGAQGQLQGLARQLAVVGCQRVGLCRWSVLHVWCVGSGASTAGILAQRRGRSKAHQGQNPRQDQAVPLQAFKPPTQRAERLLAWANSFACNSHP
jgi:hypothetical protein